MKSTFYSTAVGARRQTSWLFWAMFMALVCTGVRQAVAGQGSPTNPELEKNYWAFQRVSRPEVPSFNGNAWLLNPIDAFVLKALLARKLEPNRPAAPRELVRRVYFDLVGLPPPFEVVREFEANPSAQAYERLVDRLLASPQYGERWGRYWLDVVRFAQSNGYERDSEKVFAWRYRDYVIRAFNRDTPYDRFILEQIAGDELPGASAEAVVATGFQRLGVWDDEPDDKEVARFDELDDIVSTTGAAFLGLTLGCARCHDHKFDPMPQRDYYQLLSFFRNIRPNEAPHLTLESANYAPLAAPAEVEAWKKKRREAAVELTNRLAAATEPRARKEIEQRLSKLREQAPPFGWALAVRERSGEPLPTFILIRGNPASPSARVEPAFPEALGGGTARLERNGAAAGSSGRRLALGKWIASRDNPLTARVLVNRIWQHHFGEGIVRTTTDFGHAGAPPTHPELLDWLASEFMERGWSIKRLHKEILLSNAYRMSSRAENPEGLLRDPDNHWLWRQNLRRLEAEAIRDAMLAVSGRLNLEMGGRGFFPRLAGEVLAGESRPGLDWEMSKQSALVRRSVYTFIRRTMPVPMLETFDYGNTSAPLGERPVTTVAPQALMLLNDRFVAEAADALADRIERERCDPRTEIQRGFEWTLARDPSASEAAVAAQLFRDQENEFRQISTRLTFDPNVPTSLESHFMEQLRPSDFLTGPATGWEYFRGRWSGGYEGIRTVLRGQGPFALWEGGVFCDGTAEGRVLLHQGVDEAALLLRWRIESNVERGYAVVFEPRQQRISIQRREGGTLKALSEAKVSLPHDIPLPVKVTLRGPVVRVALEGAGVELEAVDPAPMDAPGRLGVRVWGAPMSLDEFTFRPAAEAAGNDAPLAVWSNSVRATPRHQALQTFCLMLLNLNEFIYVD